MEGEVFEAAIKAGELYHSLQIEKNTKGYNFSTNREEYKRIQLDRKGRRYG